MFAIAQENDDAKEGAIPPAPPPFTGNGEGGATPSSSGQPQGLRQITRGEFSGDRVAWTILGGMAAFLLLGPGMFLVHSGRQSTSAVMTAGFRYLLAIAVLSLAWVLWGYSLSFARSTVSADVTSGEKTAGDPTKVDGNRYIGGWRHALLQGMTSQLAGDSPVYPLRRPWDGVPHLLFMTYQMLFLLAVAAPLTGILGARLKPGSFLLFMLLWSSLIYAPIAYWTWGAGWRASVLDTAGGLLAHVNIGCMAIATALLWRRGEGRLSTEPAGSDADLDSALLAPSPWRIGMGVVLFWAGAMMWSASRNLIADGNAANAFLTTHLAACAGLVSWAGIDWLRGDRPTPIGYVLGAMSGLVAISPASGFVASESAIVVGLLGAATARFVLGLMDRGRRPSDLSQLIAVHAAAGGLGIVLTGVFATPSVAGTDRQGRPIGGLISGDGGQFIEQLIALAAVAALALLGGLVVLGVARLANVRKSKVAEECDEASEKIAAVR